MILLVLHFLAGAVLVEGMVEREVVVEVVEGVVPLFFEVFIVGVLLVLIKIIKDLPNMF